MVHALESTCGHSGRGLCQGPNGGPVVAVFAPLAPFPRPPARLWSRTVDVPGRPLCGPIAGTWSPTRHGSGEGGWVFSSSCSALPLRRAYDDDMRSFLVHQQVSQCVQPDQGPFLDGRLLRLLSSQHAGGDDDDDMVRLIAKQTMRRIRTPTLDGWYRRLCCPAPPFYLHQRRFSCRAKEPTPPTIEGKALKSSSATVAASSPAKPLSISKAFLLRWLTVHRWRALRTLLLMGLQDHVPIEDVGGALWEGVDQVIVGTSYQLFDDLGLCLCQDVYGIRVPTEVARDHAPGMGVGMAMMSFPGCSRGHGGRGAVLTPLLRPASGVPVTDSCCTVPCCHGERV